MNSSSPSLDTFILASPRQLFSGSNLSRYHSSDLSTVKTEWKGENSPRFIKHHPQFLHDLFPCSEMLDASSGPVSFFLLSGFWRFSQFAKLLSSRTTGWGFSPPRPPFLFLPERELESLQTATSSPSFQPFFPLCGSPGVEACQAQEAGIYQIGFSTATS